MKRVELREEAEVKRGPTTVDRVSVSFGAKSAFRDLVEEEMSGSNVKLTVSPPQPPGMTFIQALSEIVPKMNLEIRLKYPVEFRPNNNGFPPVRPANVREIGLVLSDLKTPFINERGQEELLFRELTLWIGTVPGYISTGLTGGANYIVEDILVKRRKEGGVLRIKSSEDFESGGVFKERELEITLTRKGEHTMFEYKQSPERTVSR
ncbi:hypothetical protein IID21_01255 [Patescibacteria group bacterium]|nr:hypothetical protein [Patescibacteria group bacterium]